MAVLDPNYEEPLLAKIQKLVRREMDEIVNEEARIATIRLEKRIQEFAAQCSIRLAEWVDVERIKNRIVISVHMPKDEK